jgi:hypothetical protein
MTAESQSTEPAKPADTKTAEDPRGRSTIEFPYFDQASAVAIAQAVKDVGGTSADVTQIAVKLSMSGDGGGFRLRLMTAKTFGLVEYARNVVDLTELGIRIVDPKFERGARLDSFMRVPLYKALFDKLNGQTLPPTAAIERMVEQLGVAPKQKDKARQVFMRSAKYAGLFELSAERLSLPPGTSGPGREQPGAEKPASADNGGGGEPPTSGRLRFEVPIPGKPSATVLVPDDLDADDWTMLSAMMTTYIERWKKFSRT